MSNIVIPDGGNIGSASDADAISIPANGKPTFSAGIANTGTIDAGTLGSSVSFSDRSNYKISTVLKSDGHTEGLNTILFDSLCYVEFYDLAVGDRILLHFVGSCSGKWWVQGRWSPSFSWGCYIDTGGGNSPNFGNVWAKNDGQTDGNTYEKRIVWDRPDQVGGANNTWAFDTNAFTAPNISGDHGYFIAGDANNLSGNDMATNGAGWHLLQIPSGFAGSYRFHRIIRAVYWQDQNGSFYPYNSDTNIPHYLEAWKLDGGPIQ
jgi:hypothetical protein